MRRLLHSIHRYITGVLFLLLPTACFSLSGEFMLLEPVEAAPPRDSIDVAFTLNLDSVVVRGQRHGMLFHRAPMSLSSVKVGRQVSGQKDLRVLSGVVPNFYMQEGGLRMSCPIYVRGVGSSMGAPPVGLYVDGVPSFDRDAFFLSMVGVAGVEILRGPQTTLYGRNSAMGQINVQTLPPSDKWQLSLARSFGSFGEAGILAVGNVPLGPVRTRLTFSRQVGRGYFVNLGEGGISNAGHEAYLARLRTEILAGPRGRVEVGLDWNSALDAGYGYHAVDSLRLHPFRVNYDFPSSIRRERLGSFLRFSGLLGGVNLETTVAYSLARDWQTMDADFTHYSVFNNARETHQHLVSGEFLMRASHLQDRLQWLVGLFGLYRDNRRLYSADFGEDRALMLGVGAAFVKQLDYSNLNREIGAAGFGQVTYLERYTGLHFTVGLRAEYEMGRLDYHETLFTPIGATTPWGHQQHAMRLVRLLPRVAVSRQFYNQLFTAYASFARGYRPGGYNAVNNDPMADEVHVEYGPEQLLSYELGLKFRTPSHRLQLASALFFLDWRDQQIFQIERMGPAIRNAGDAHSLGGEVELVYSPWAWLFGTLTGGYSRARCVRHTRSEVVGKRLVMAPEFTSSAAINGHWLLDREKNATLSAQVRYSAMGMQSFDEMNTLNQPYHGRLDLQLGVSYYRFSLRCQVTNALDSRYFVYLFKSPVGKRLPSYENSGQMGAPRTFHAVVEFSL